jgi:hypothetical protein
MTNVVSMDEAMADAQRRALASLSNRPVTNGGALSEKSDKPLLVDAGEWLAVADRQEWVVDGVVQRGSLYSVTAATNHGKTAITLLLAICVATGRRFSGRHIVPGNVLILCGEDPNGFRPRLRATIEKLGLEREDIIGRVTVLPYALPLREHLDQIKQEAATRGDLSLVLVDTSVAFFTGDSEDDNLQARAHAWDLRELTELPGKPAVLVNCHPTKGADRESLTPRGGGAFLNEIDTNLTVWAEGETATLHWQRKKRGPDFDPIPFEFMGVSLQEGDYKVQTVVAWPITDEREQQIRKARNQDEDRLLYAMLHYPNHHYAEWSGDCGWNSEAGAPSKSKVFRVMNRLKEDGLVAKTRRGYGLTPKGQKEAEKVD